MVSTHFDVRDIIVHVNSARWKVTSTRRKKNAQARMKLAAPVAKI
jgi:hypothetical protein